MKTRKILALMLSIVMVFSLCSTAFAAHLTDEITELEVKNSDLSMHLATQGYVLLENNGILPLDKADYSNKVAVFGSAAESTIKGGTGSGDVNQRTHDNIDEALVAAGWELTNPTWLAKMEKQKAPSGAYGMGQGAKLDLVITDEELEEAKDADLVIYAIARNAGEDADRQLYEGNGDDGSLYHLTSIEKDNLAKLTANFENVVIVFNTCVIDTSWVSESNNIDAIVYMNNGGQRGSEALVKILEGEVTPSGKLTDTWALKYEDYPNAETFAYVDGNSNTEVYNEDIYVGYRYFDTYGVEVSYPFGYGLSYTTFDIGVKNVKADAEKVAVEVDVTNTGSTYSGKEVVEVYFSAPDGALNKPYQELAAYGKTDELKPGQKQTLTISYATTDMSSYSEELAAYIMEDGEYIIRVGNSSRNTHVAAVVVIEEDVITEQLVNQMPIEIDYDFMDGSDATPITYEGEKGEIESAERITVTDIETIDNSDYLKELDTETVTSYIFAEDYENYSQMARTEEDSIRLQTKSVLGILNNSGNSDPTATGSNSAPKGYSVTTYKEVIEVVDALPEGITRENAKLTDVYNGKITMEQFVACLTVQELARICVGGASGSEQSSEGTQIDGTASTVHGGAFQTTDAYYYTRHIPAMPNADGPAGVRITQHYWLGSNGKVYTSLNRLPAGVTVVDQYQYCTAFPVGMCMANTWDTEAIESFGYAVGSEMKEYGVTSWLAPSMNIHRNPLCGRNFEYYSEDPLVSGITAAYTTLGVQSHTGIGVTLKHYWGNDQEDNRFVVNNVISERAAREIYLKAFEIPVKMARPQCIMTSYNQNNGWPAADSYDSCTDLARGEWGFTGYIMTDWTSRQGTEYIEMHSGNDMIMPGGNPKKILNGLVQAPTFNADGSIASAGSFKVSADGTKELKVVVDGITSEAQLPQSVQNAINAKEASFTSGDNGGTVTWYGEFNYNGEGRGTIALGDVQKSAISILNVALISQDMEKLIAANPSLGTFKAPSLSEYYEAPLANGWTMVEKGEVENVALLAGTVEVDATEATTVEVPVSYNGDVEITSVRFTADSEVGALVGIESDYEVTYNANNGQILVYEAEANNISGVLATLVYDVSGVPANGEYAVDVEIIDATGADTEKTSLTAVDGAVIVNNTYDAGDANLDGEVTNADVIAIARVLVELDNLTADQMALADIDGDGDVDNSDLIKLVRMIVEA